MFELFLVLSIFSLVVNVSQGVLRNTTETPIISDSTPKIITSFEPTTVTEGVPVTDITNATNTPSPPIGTEPGTDETETTETQPPPIGTEPGTDTTETTDTQPPPIGTKPGTDTTETTDTQPPPIGTEPGTETTETTDTQPPPIGTDTTPTPTFRSTIRTTTQTFPTIPPPICCGQNEFSHYTYAGVPEYCDPICNDLTKKCIKKYSPGALNCYCYPRHCRDGNNICVLIRDAKKKCYLRK